MSWIDRLVPLKMTSPENDTFTPKWIGNERSREKKVGIFSYPDIAGSIVQDLDINATKWPLTIYFDGSDNDIESERFFKATAQKGLWSVEHPVKGIIDLQLLTINDSIQPVTSGNVTAANIEFIEPVSSSVIQSALELQSSVGSSIIDSNEKTLEQFVASVGTARGKLRAAVNNATTKVNAAINKILGPIAKLDATLNSNFNAVSRAIDTTITNVILAPDVLAGQIQSLVQLPGNIITSTEEKITAYGNLINEVYKVSGDTKETFAVKDLVLTSANAALADVAANTDAKTRTEIVSQIENISGLFDGIVNQLDNDQDLVNTDKIEDQYISQESSFPQNLLVTSLAVNFLLNASFDLSIEKRFTLKEYKLPILICVEEYGTYTEDLLDFFYSTNKISGLDHLLLSPGFEVVVYPGVVL